MFHVRKQVQTHIAKCKQHGLSKSDPVQMIKTVTSDRRHAIQDANGDDAFKASEVH